LKKKYCPFIYNPNSCENRECSQNCALYIKVVKRDPNPMNFGGILEYEGCGLVQHIPWKPRKTRQENKEEYEIKSIRKLLADIEKEEDGT